jgi:hypothetical protein
LQLNENASNFLIISPGKWQWSICYNTILAQWHSGCQTKPVFGSIQYIICLCITNLGLILLIVFYFTGWPTYCLYSLKFVFVKCSLYLSYSSPCTCIIPCSMVFRQLPSSILFIMSPSVPIQDD